MIKPEQTIMVINSVNSRNLNATGVAQYQKDYQGIKGWHIKFNRPIMCSNGKLYMEAWGPESYLIGLTPPNGHKDVQAYDEAPKVIWTNMPPSYIFKPKHGGRPSK